MNQRQMRFLKFMRSEKENGYPRGLKDKKYQPLISFDENTNENLIYTIGNVRPQVEVRLPTNKKIVKVTSHSLWWTHVEYRDGTKDSLKPDTEIQILKYPDYPTNYRYDY